MGTKSLELVPISFNNNRSYYGMPGYCYCGRFILTGPYGPVGRGTRVIKDTRRTWFRESLPLASLRKPVLRSFFSRSESFRRHVTASIHLSAIGSTLKEHLSISFKETAISLNFTRLAPLIMEGHLTICLPG